MIREDVREEAEIIRHSGEIPEVAFWNSIYYLTSDEEGPLLKLTSQEIRHLKKAVVERYLIIIERDLTVENIGKSFYRGVSRAMVNWERLSSFARREGFSQEALRQQVIEKFRRFLREISSNSLKIDVPSGKLASWLRKRLACSPQILS